MPACDSRILQQNPQALPRMLHTAPTRLLVTKAAACCAIRAPKASTQRTTHIRVAATAPERLCCTSSYQPKHDDSDNCKGKSGSCTCPWHRACDRLPWSCISAIQPAAMICQDAVVCSCCCHLSSHCCARVAVSAALSSCRLACSSTSVNGTKCCTKVTPPQLPLLQPPLLTGATVVLLLLLMLLIHQCRPLLRQCCCCCCCRSSCCRLLLAEGLQVVEP